MQHTNIIFIKLCRLHFTIHLYDVATEISEITQHMGIQFFKNATLKVASDIILCFLSNREPLWYSRGAVENARHCNFCL